MLSYPKKLSEVISEGVKAFAGIKEGDSMVVGTGKAALIAVKRTLYTIADYWLAALCAALNIMLKAYGIQLLYAFLIMWLVNIVIAGFFIAFYIRTGHDISLGEDLRRATDAMREKSKLAGYISMLAVIFQAVFWSGPEQVVIYFRKEIGGISGMLLAMLFLTAI